MSAWRDMTLPTDFVRRRMKIETDGSAVMETAQPVRALFKDNRERHAEEVASSTSLWKDRSMVMVGRIPLTLIEQWQREGIDVYKNGADPDVQKKISQYLNSIEYEALRTAPGKV